MIVEQERYIFSYIFMIAWLTCKCICYVIYPLIYFIGTAGIFHYPRWNTGRRPRPRRLAICALSARRRPCPPAGRATRQLLRSGGCHGYLRNVSTLSSDVKWRADFHQWGGRIGRCYFFGRLERCVDVALLGLPKKARVRPTRQHDLIWAWVLAVS